MTALCLQRTQRQKEIDDDVQALVVSNRANLEHKTASEAVILLEAYDGEPGNEVFERPAHCIFKLGHVLVPACL